MSRMQLWMCRHGETVANKQKVIQGQTDGELTQVGKKQAQLLGKRLASEEFDFVYVSDLGRTKQTHSYVAAQHNALHEGHGVAALPEPIYTEECRERNAGAFEGYPFGTSDKEAYKAGVAVRDFVPPEGESWAQMCERAGRFLDMLVVAHYADAIEHCAKEGAKEGGGEGLRVLVVSHGGFIKEFVNATRCGLEEGKLYPNHCRNTSVFKFDVTCSAPGEEPKVDMVLDNDISHLQKYEKAKELLTAKSSS